MHCLWSGLWSSQVCVCVCVKLVKQFSNKHGWVVQGGGQSGAAPARPSLLEPAGAAQQSAPAAQRSAQTLSLRSETPSPDQAQMSTDAVDVVAQKHTSVVRDPTDNTHRPSVVSDNAAEEEEGQQASGSKGNSPEGDKEVKRKVAGGEEEQGEEAVVGHREEEEQGEAAPDAQAAPAMPWGSMPPGNTPPHAVCICCESVVTG